MQKWFQLCSGSFWASDRLEASFNGAMLFQHGRPPASGIQMNSRLASRIARGDCCHLLNWCTFNQAPF